MTTGHVLSGGTALATLDRRPFRTDDRVVVSLDDPLLCRRFLGTPKVLVVDDDDGTRERIVTMLEVDGLIALEAADGEIAMTIALSECPDLVILDVLMPGLSGYSVCRQLRDDLLMRKVPVLMVSALSHLGDELEGMNSGADGFLVKPFSRTDLMSRVWDLL